MTWKQWTAAVIIAGVAAWIIWDLVIVGAAPSMDATISAIILDWAVRLPFIPFAVGVLCGHWFWPLYRYRHETPGTWRYWVLGALGAALLAVDILWLDNVFPLIPLALGIPIGHYLWPQKLGA